MCDACAISHSLFSISFRYHLFVSPPSDSNSFPMRVCVCVCVRVYLRPQKPCVVARHSDHVWRCAVCHISIFSYFISSTMIVFTFNRKWWRCLATFQLINIQTRGLFAVWLNTSQTYDFYTYSQTWFSLQRTLKVLWLWKFSHLKFLLWILSPIPLFWHCSIT